MRCMRCCALVVVTLRARYGHFLMPSLRHADFMAVAEMPSFTAALCSGSVNSCDRVASFSTTGWLLVRACCPCFRRGKMVLTLPRACVSFSDSSASDSLALSLFADTSALTTPGEPARCAARYDVASGARCAAGERAGLVIIADMDMGVCRAAANGSSDDRPNGTLVPGWSTRCCSAGECKPAAAVAALLAIASRSRSCIARVGAGRAPCACSRDANGRAWCCCSWCCGGSGRCTIPTTALPCQSMVSSLQVLFGVLVGGALLVREAPQSNGRRRAIAVTRGARRSLSFPPPGAWI